MVPRTAIVTGATRGIGRATAVALARRGYDVAITGRTRKEGDAVALPEARQMPEVAAAGGSLESTAAAIEAHGQRAVPLVLDLLDGSSLAPVAERAVSELGHVDVLVNNAIYVGPYAENRLLDTPPHELEKRVYGNVTAQLLFLQPVLRHMVDRGMGTVANMTTAAAYLRPRAVAGEGGWSLIYGVSKAGFHRIAEQLAIEYPQLTVVNVQPGQVITERVAAAGEKLAFVARGGAPVDIVGEATARIVDEIGQFDSGSTIQIQDQARAWGMLP
jgi:NAD(P)-dependent dehydrogenase (short-subunit alcohol dehydrogenase family)